MYTKNYQRQCAGCAANSQKIQILENRIAYLEQHMITRSSTPNIHKPRSRSNSRRRRHKSPKPAIKKDTKPKDDNMNKTIKKISEIKITTLPEYVPQNSGASTSTLNPVATPFQPVYTYGYQYPDPDGGRSGYQEYNEPQ